MINISKNFRPEKDELEKVVLGMILFLGRLSSAKQLNSQQFKDMRNKFIFEIMEELESERQTVSYVNISDRLKNKGIETNYLERLRNQEVSETMLFYLVELLKEQDND